MKKNSDKDNFLRLKQRFPFVGDLVNYCFSKIQFFRNWKVF